MVSVTSNVFAVSWTRPAAPPAPGGYTPFPFVTRSDPPQNHTGVANRPGYSPTNPPSASIIDPMSGLQIFRLTGNLGSTCFINGTQNSGLLFPSKLRQENNGNIAQMFNADGTLLMIDRRFSRSADPSNSVSSVLIDVNGTYGASAPWRIIRASGSTGLGQAGQYWFWDRNDPLLAWIVSNDGTLRRWNPVTGSIQNAYGPLASGLGNVHQTRRGMLITSEDGRYFCCACYRASEQRWGGVRRDLQTGAQGPFVVSPDWQYGLPQGRDRSAEAISGSGLYTSFNRDGAVRLYKNLVTGATVSFAEDGGLSHAAMVRINGRDYHIGCQTDQIDLWDIAAGTRRRLITPAGLRGSNPNHLSSWNLRDNVANFGSPNGSGLTSGPRYVMYVRSGDRQGHPRGILAIRLGPNDQNVLRYLCNHGSSRHDNSDECHPQPDPYFRKVCFNSDWTARGNTGNESQVHPYIVLIPDAFHSPNNNGS